jgi:two-component system phosphate regulon response regulator OmpR
MKSTALNTTCVSGTCRAARGGKHSAARGAHTPARHRVGPGACAEPALFVQGTDHPAYIEAAPAARPWPAGAVHTGYPRVLHIDTETGTAAVLASLLGSGVNVTHVATLADARALLQKQIFSLVILDPALPDGDATTLLPLLADTPLLFYSDRQPGWREGTQAPFLSKSWTTARELWTRMSTLLWNTSALSAGD